MSLFDKKNVNPGDWRKARETYKEDKHKDRRSTSWDSILEILFAICIVGGVLSLILAPFTGLTVVTAAAFFVCAWFIHKWLGGI